jgi:hypothetical protein
MGYSRAPGGKLQKTLPQNWQNFPGLDVIDFIATKCWLREVDLEFGHHVQQPHGIFVDLPVGKDEDFVKRFDYGSNDRGRR